MFKISPLRYRSAGRELQVDLSAALLSWVADLPRSHPGLRASGTAPLLLSNQTVLNQTVRWKILLALHCLTQLFPRHPLLGILEIISIFDSVGGLTQVSAETSACSCVLLQVHDQVNSNPNNVRAHSDG